MKNAATRRRRSGVGGAWRKGRRSGELVCPKRQFSGALPSLEVSFPRHLPRRPSLALLRLCLMKPLALELDLGDESLVLARAELIRDRRNQSLHQRDALGQRQLVRIIHQLAKDGMIHPVGLAARRHEVRLGSKASSCFFMLRAAFSDAGTRG